MGCGQEKGEARSGTTGEPFDEPTAQNAPALRVLFRRAPAVLRRSTDVTASLFAPRLAVASPQQNAAESIRSQLALRRHARRAHVPAVLMQHYGDNVSFRIAFEAEFRINQFVEELVLGTGINGQRALAGQLRE